MFKTPTEQQLPVCGRLALSPIVAKDKRSFGGFSAARNFQQFHADHSVAIDNKPLFTASSPSNRYQLRRDRFSTASSTTQDSSDVSVDVAGVHDAAMECDVPATDTDMHSPQPVRSRLKSPLAKTPNRVASTAASTTALDALATTPVGSLLGNRAPLRRMLSKERLAASKLVAKELPLSPLVDRQGLRMSPRMSPQLARVKGIRVGASGDSTPQRRLVKKVGCAFRI